MKSKQLRIRLVGLFCALLLLFGAVVGGQGILPAFAAGETRYSNVLDDLQKDPEFDADMYIDNFVGAPIEVIQIAESEDGELFVYTYQPSQKVLYTVATRINMSLSETVDGTKLYDLVFLSSSGVFCKYMVKNFAVSKDKIRNYNISTIYRPYNSIADGASLSSYKGIAFGVGQVWTVTTENGTVSYTNQSIDVITVTDCKYGTVRVPEGFNWWLSSSVDMHILAFSTDIKMDNLLEADVSFKYRSVKDGIYGNDESYGPWYSKTVPVSYTEKGQSNARIFGKSSKTWDKISTSSDFLDKLSKSGIETDKAVRDDILKQEWVIAFWETSYTNNNGGVFGWLGYIGSVFGYKNIERTQVSDATILRLEFIRDNVHYNLGAVSNITGEFEKIGGGDVGFFRTIWNGIKSFFVMIGNFFKWLWSAIVGFFKRIPWWVWLIVGTIVFVAIVTIIVVLLKRRKNGDG